MKLLLLSLILPVSALAAREDLVTCQVKNFQACQDCGKRIPASCENHAFNGSLEIKIKPQKIQWLVFNAEAGTEKIVTTENKSLTLKDLKNSKNLKILSAKTKLKTTAKENVSLYAIQLASNTALYKQQAGQAIAAQMKPQGNLRNVASTQDPMAGGVKRAQTNSQNHK